MSAENPLSGLTSTFGIYDFFCHFFVGAFFLINLHILYFLYKNNFALPIENFWYSGVYFVIVSFVVGVILQNLSHSPWFNTVDSKTGLNSIEERIYEYPHCKISNKICIMRKKEQKEDIEDGKLAYIIHDTAREFFKIKNKEIPTKLVAQYCYLYSLRNDFSGQVKQFNWLYNFHRGLWAAEIIICVIYLTAFGVLCITTLVSICEGGNIRSLLGVTGLSVMHIFLAQLFNQAKDRFNRLAIQKKLITFEILAKNLLQRNK